MLTFLHGLDGVDKDVDSLEDGFDGVLTFLHGLDGVDGDVDSLEDGFDGVLTFLHGLDGADGDVDTSEDGFDGVLTFVHGLHGAVVVTAEAVVGFTTSNVVVSHPVISDMCVSSLISSTLLHLCCENELELEVKLRKLVARFRLVLVVCRLATCNDGFGTVFGVEK